MSNTPQQFEYILASDLSADELITGKLDGTVIDYRTDIHGRKWVKRPQKLPMIFSEPEGEITIHGGDEVIEADGDSLEESEGRTRLLDAFNATGRIEQDLADCDPDQEAELKEMQRAAIERLGEEIEEIRARAWAKPWTPGADEDGYDD